MVTVESRHLSNIDVDIAELDGRLLSGHCFLSLLPVLREKVRMRVISSTSDIRPSRNYPHPSPLPEYRARGKESTVADSTTSPASADRPSDEHIAWNHRHHLRLPDRERSERLDPVRRNCTETLSLPFHIDLPPNPAVSCETAKGGSLIEEVFDRFRDWRN